MNNKRGYEQMKAENHYNDLKRDKISRHLSNIYHLRLLNNWIKSELINFSRNIIDQSNKAKKRSPIDVLDLGCGKGGDLNKWLNQSTYTEIGRYIGVDIAINSLNEMVNERLVNRHDKHKIPMLIRADLSIDSLSSSILSTHTWKSNISKQFISQWNEQVPFSTNDESLYKFDIISCQFALHYFFQTKDIANHFFNEISKYLKPNGLFIATTTDSKVIRQIILDQEYGEINLNSDHSINNNISIHNEFSQKLLDISFEKTIWDQIIGLSPSNGYGLQCNFDLYDNPDEAAVNAPEWLVPQGKILEELLFNHDMKVIKYRNFHKFIYELLNESKLRSQFQSYNILNYKGRITKAEWDIAKLYCIFIIQKNNIKPQSKSISLSNGNVTSSVNVNKSNKLSIQVVSKEHKEVKVIANPYISNLDKADDFIPQTPPGTPPPIESEIETKPKRDKISKFVPQSPPQTPPNDMATHKDKLPMFIPQTPPDSPPNDIANLEDKLGSFIPQTPPGSPPNNESTFNDTTDKDYISRNFEPNSPVDTPPVTNIQFVPKSPEDSPPYSSMGVVDSNISHDRITVNNVMETDHETETLLRIRSIAIDLAGGDDIWDDLDEDHIDMYMKKAERLVN